MLLLLSNQHAEKNLTLPTKNKNIMKKILSFPFSIFIFLQSILPFAANAITAKAAEQPPTSAQSSYACILQNGAYFYAQPDEKRGLFLLPKTYYVKILDYQSDYCKIEYLYDDLNVRKITGYAKTSDLTFVDYIPKRPYLYYIFDVQYEIDDAQINDSAFLTQITVTCAYYGDFYLGATAYCYVLRGDTFGYVPKPATLSYEENYEYADYLAQQTPPPQSETPAPTQDSPPLQIGILIAFCLLIPLLAAIILKQPKPAYDYPMEEQLE